MDCEYRRYSLYSECQSSHFWSDLRVFQLAISSQFITYNNLTFQNAQGPLLSLQFYFRAILWIPFITNQSITEYRGLHIAKGETYANPEGG